MPDMTQLLQTGATAALQSLLPQQQQAAAPQVTYVQAPKSTTPKWLLWGGIAVAGLVGLVVLKKVMGRKSGGTAAAATPTATNPRRRRKVRITRRRR